MTSRPDRPSKATLDRYGLPFRTFLYTLDQISDMLAVDASRLTHYDTRSPGLIPKDKLLARNIMPAGQPPEWRISETEYLRWLRHTGIIPVGRSAR